MKVRQIKYRMVTRQGMFRHAMKFVEAQEAAKTAQLLARLNSLLEKDHVTLNYLQEAEVDMPEAKQYTVSRKKDGGVVGVYETLAEAEDVIAKAKAQKKAALVLQ